MLLLLAEQPPMVGYSVQIRLEFILRLEPCTRDSYLGRRQCLLEAKRISYFFGHFRMAPR